MELKLVNATMPEGANIIIGQAHFIKTVEDLYEIIKTAAPDAKFGVALCEASGPCLIRSEGNDEQMRKSAIDNALAIGAGHIFVIVMKNAFPISVLNQIKACHEVAGILLRDGEPSPGHSGRDSSMARACSAWSTASVQLEWKAKKMWMREGLSSGR